MARRPHYAGSYDVRSRQLRRAAAADPSTRCWRCGLTIAEVRRKFAGRRVFWTAGHTIDSDPNCVLLPECSVCNFTAGAELGLHRRRSSGGTGRV